MKDQPECEFIVLAYVLDRTQDTMSPVAVVAREVAAKTEQGLILHLAAVIGTVASKRHLEYLYELFGSWQGMAGDRLGALFEELRELSSGPLRIHSSGSCSIGDLSHVVNQALGANEELNKPSENRHGQSSHGLPNRPKRRNTLQP